ncbi:MAG: flavin reductase family protein [Vulcanimicrobiaceae bacterium]
MLQTLQPPEPRSLRSVLGRFPTGVTVVTTMHGAEPYGVTVNSFTSVSLSPPLVLVCIKRGSRFLMAVAAHGAFAVNVMNDDQVHVVKLFAQRDRDPRDVCADMTISPLGVPLLAGSIAYLDCTVNAMYTAGDHAICVGEVKGMQMMEVGHPLVFVAGAFRFIGAPCERTDEPSESWPWC